MPAAAVLARRASRKVKPMRDEPGSDWNADESEEWEDDDEVRVRTPSVAACGFMVSASHQTAWRSTTTAAREFGREGLRHARRLWCVGCGAEWRS